MYLRGSAQTAAPNQMAAAIWRAILVSIVNLTLNSKVALITGGSRGIGAAAVRMFAGSGAKVVFNYQSAQAQAEDLVRECGPDPRTRSSDQILGLCLCRGSGPRMWPCQLPC